LTYRSLGSDFPSVPVDDALSGSQSYSSAFKLLRPMQTLKHPEEFICILHIKACSVVPYEHLYFVFFYVGRANLDFGRCSHPSELNRIGNQVHKDNFQHRAVAVAHRQRPDIPCDIPAARFLPKLRDDLPDKLLQVHGRLSGLRPPDPGKRQQIVN